MRISDWSSDVCSSDLPLCERTPPPWSACSHSGPSRSTNSAPRATRNAGATASDEQIMQPTMIRNLRARASVRNASASRSEEHTSELQSLMRISYAVFCLKKRITRNHKTQINHRSRTQDEELIKTRHTT